MDPEALVVLLTSAALVLGGAGDLTLLRRRRRTEPTYPARVVTGFCNPRIPGERTFEFEVDVDVQGRTLRLPMADVNPPPGVVVPREYNRAGTFSTPEWADDVEGRRQLPHSFPLEVRSGSPTLRVFLRDGTPELSRWSRRERDDVLLVLVGVLGMLGTALALA